jgi:sugar-specific transcriptional regulator TrmB
VTEGKPQDGGESQPRTEHELTDHHPLEAAAAVLYEEAVRSDGLSPDYLQLRQRSAFELLTGLGLLTLDSADDLYRPRDPATAQARLVTSLSRQGAELVAESSHWAKAFSTLSQTWKRSSAAANSIFVEIHGRAAINQFIAEALREAEFEVLTAHPQDVRPPIVQRMAMAEIELDAIERGVIVRTLYEHSARRDAATHRYVQLVAEKGSETRTLDDFFHRMLVFDRSMAIIPSADGIKTAVVIREPSVVAYLIDIYERAWERARPFGTQEADALHNIATQQRAMAIRMLIRGYSDPASAKRLGVSLRTYASYVAELKDKYSIESRFQLGYYMGQRGITGEEKPAEGDVE